MKLRLVAVGAKSPGWVDAGYAEYARRMPRECALELVEIAPANRKGWPVARMLADVGADEEADDPSLLVDPRSARAQVREGPPGASTLDRISYRGAAT